MMRRTGIKMTHVGSITEAGSITRQAIWRDLRVITIFTSVGLLGSAAVLGIMRINLFATLPWSAFLLFYLSNILLFGFLLPGGGTWTTQQRVALLYLASFTKAHKLRALMLWWSFWCHGFKSNRYVFDLDNKAKEAVIYELAGKWVWRVHGQSSSRGFSRRRLKAFIQACNSFHEIQEKIPASQAQ